MELGSQLPCLTVKCFMISVCLSIGLELHVSVSVQNHDQFVVQLLNGVGDYFDLKYVINPKLRPNFHRMSMEQIKEYIALSGHCSALVKVLQLRSYR